jgi:hypothetical protein
LIVRRRKHEIRRYFFKVAVNISRFYTSDDRFRKGLSFVLEMSSTCVEGTRVAGVKKLKYGGVLLQTAFEALGIR